MAPTQLLCGVVAWLILLLVCVSLFPICEFFPTILYYTFVPLVYKPLIFASAAYLSSPCHIELILTEREQIVPRAEEELSTKKKVSKKKLARQKMKQQD